MKNNIIAFSGAHGTGKTTATFVEAVKLKKEGFDVWVIQEVARNCPFPVYSLNDSTTRESQLWIFAEQLKEEIFTSANSRNFVVSDRTLVDCIAYAKVAGYNDLVEAMMSVANVHKKIYKKILFLPSTKQNLVGDGFRNIDVALQKRVERELLLLYEQLYINVTIL